MNIPRVAIVPVKQDPYSPFILTNYNTAKNIQESANTRIGGKRRRKTRRRSRGRKQTRNSLKKTQLFKL